MCMQTGGLGYDDVTGVASRDVMTSLHHVVGSQQQQHYQSYVADVNSSSTLPSGTLTDYTQDQRRQR